MEQTFYRRNKSEIDADSIVNYMTPSSALWHHFPIATIRKRPELGYYRYENWRDLPLAPTLTTQIAFGKYKAFANTGCTISRVSTVNSVEKLGGALNIATDTDNDAAVIADAYPSFRMSGDPTVDGLLCFEACIAQASVATNMAASFVGLGEVEQFTLANTVPFNAGNPIDNSGAMIGFRMEEDGLGVIDAVYSDRATSFTNAIDDIGANDEGGEDLVAYTFAKVGFRYNPRETDTCIRWFWNNKELATKTSKATLQALTNLDANALGFLLGTVADSGGTAHILFCPWYAVGQLNPGAAL